AGVSGGYSANLLLGTVDPLLAGITQEAAQLIDTGYEVDATANWYFMIVSTFLITALGTWITIKIVEPKLGDYDSCLASLQLAEEKLEPLDLDEKRALMWAGVAALGVALLIASMVVPSFGALRHPETGDIAGSPFLRGIVALIFVFFLVPGTVYGFVR